MSKDKPVGINTLPNGGIVTSSVEYKSNPESPS